MLAAASVRRVGWPPTKVGTGPALDKHDVAVRLGYKSTGPVEGLIRRTRNGQPPVPFPTPDGSAVRPGRPDRPATGHVVPYWFERRIVDYGKRVGLLDWETGQPVDVPARNQHTVRARLEQLPAK
jgi:hypothetical protein